MHRLAARGLPPGAVSKTTTFGKTANFLMGLRFWDGQVLVECGVTNGIWTQPLVMVVQIRSRKLLHYV